jgi:hypothetical protein
VSYPLDPEVPGALRAVLEEEPSEADDFTILVLTLGEEWPHLAMVSRGELVCTGDRVLALALWPASTACANLARNSRATLSAVVDTVAYSVRVTARRLSDVTTQAAGSLACFRLEVESVTGDQAPYARLESGVRFRLLDPEPTVDRWREVRRKLRGAVETS